MVLTGAIGRLTRFISLQIRTHNDRRCHWGFFIFTRTRVDAPSDIAAFEYTISRRSAFHLKPFGITLNTYRAGRLPLHIDTLANACKSLVRFHRTCTLRPRVHICHHRDLLGCGCRYKSGYSIRHETPRVARMAVRTTEYFSRNRSQSHRHFLELLAAFLISGKLNGLPWPARPKTSFC